MARAKRSSPILVPRRGPEIVLVTLTERLSINRWHLLHVMTERDQLSSCAMRRHAGLDTD